MEIPLGLEIEANISKVWKLKKSLYGLKQSPRAWFDRFTKAVKLNVEGRISIIIVYVDDIILTEDHVEEICKLKSFLAHEFEIKDLGNLKYFPKMEIVG